MHEFIRSKVGHSVQNDSVLDGGVDQQKLVAFCRHSEFGSSEVELG